MISWHDHLLRRVRGLFLVALVLLPVALAGHHHATVEDGAPLSCPVCAVTHHTPAVKVAVQPFLAPTRWRVTRPATRFTAPPVEVFRPFTPGRAPPLSCSQLA